MSSWRRKALTEPLPAKVNPARGRFILVVQVEIRPDIAAEPSLSSASERQSEGEAHVQSRTSLGASVARSRPNSSRPLWSAPREATDATGAKTRKHTADRQKVLS